MKNHLYAIDTKALQDRDIFDFWYGKMTPERRKKTDAFRFDKDKRLSLGAGILLREGLLRAGVQDISVAYGEHGKPYLKAVKDIYFNLSHSGQVVVCAVSDREVGADVEAVRGFNKKLTDYVFVESEKAFIENGKDCPDRLCTKLWTAKESVMKYFGTGIGLEPKRICINMKKPVRVQCEGYDTNQLRLTFYKHDDYYITICSEYEDFASKPEWINLL